MIAQGWERTIVSAHFGEVGQRPAVILQHSEQSVVFVSRNSGRDHCQWMLTTCSVYLRTRNPLLTPEDPYELSGHRADNVNNEVPC
jgi:hypothetical protein